jgi:hypothetical protein
LIPVASLLPAGRDVLAVIPGRVELGFRAFKWKVGAGDPADELSLLDDVLAALPSGSKLRLDANGAWDRRQSERWLERCAERPIEHVEQPVSPENRAAVDLLLGLAGDYPTPIALDESLVGQSEIETWLDRGWPGVYVIKPGLLADPRTVLDRLHRARARVVFFVLSGDGGGRARLPGMGLRLAWRGTGARIRGLAAFPGCALRRTLSGALLALAGRDPPGPGAPMDRAELSGRLGGGPLRPGGSDTVVCEEDPARFHAALAAAVAGRGRVFLADPAWRESERAEFHAILKAASAAGPADGEGERGWLCLPTGGSSGRIKLARHDAATLAAAVAGFTRHFGVTRVDAVGFLPLHHVSGLMAWLRTRLTGGSYQAAPLE